MHGDQSMGVAPPGGLHDLLPEETEHVATLRAQLKALFVQYGYAPVTTPAFEHEDVLSRALDSLDGAELIRFIDTRTGNVSVLRPDITPQIARIVATRMSDRSPPWRLSYAGTVFRQPQRRARQTRQISQVGIEHIGPAHHDVDAEVLNLAVLACHKTGLQEFTVELSNPTIGKRLFTEGTRYVDEASLGQAIARKDCHELDRLLKAGGAGRDLRKQLLRLTELWGDTKVLQRASRLFSKEPKVRKAIGDLMRLAGGLEEAGIDVCVDLGEVRGRSYYTGFRFQILAEGPGEAIGGGGRYDGLLARFGLQQGGAGFAFDLGHLAWASQRNQIPSRPFRLVCDEADIANELRSEQLHVAFQPRSRKNTATSKASYLDEWNYDGWLSRVRNTHQLLNREGKTITLKNLDVATIQAALSQSAASNSKKNKGKTV